METKPVNNVVSLPTRTPEQPVPDRKNSRFQGDFGLAGIWQEFGRVILSKNQPIKNKELSAIKGVEIACSMADDIKKQGKKRQIIINSFFMREEVRGALARFFVVNDDRPRPDQLQAITVLTQLVQPGLPVNLRDLETQVAEKTPGTITTNYLRYNLIPLMKDIGLIVQPKEGVNGWQWRDIDKKESIKDITQKALKQVSLMASPVHRELVDEQTKRYALLQQEKTLKQRIALEKGNQKLITQVQLQAEENEKAMLALGMKKQVNNNPAWIASAAVAIVALVVIGRPLMQPVDNIPVQQASMYEDAPSYPMTDEEILRQQYKLAGINWDEIPTATQTALLEELKQQSKGVNP